MKLYFDYKEIEYYNELSLKLSIYHGVCAVNYYHKRDKKSHSLYVNASTLIRMSNIIDDTYLMYTEADKITRGQIDRYYKFLGLLHSFFHEVEGNIKK